MKLNQGMSWFFSIVEISNKTVSAQVAVEAVTFSDILNFLSNNLLTTERRIFMQRFAHFLKLLKTFSNGESLKSQGF